MLLCKTFTLEWHVAGEHHIQTDTPKQVSDEETRWHSHAPDVYWFAICLVTK